MIGGGGLAAPDQGRATCPTAQSTTKIGASYLQRPPLRPPGWTSAAQTRERAVCASHIHNLQVQVVPAPSCKPHNDFGINGTSLGFFDFQPRRAVMHHDSSVLATLSPSSASAVKWKMVFEKIRIKLLKHLDTFKRIAERRSTQD